MTRTETALAYAGSMLLAVVLLGSAVAQVRTATKANGQNLKVVGSIVIVQPDIELSLQTAGGLQEPRKEWSDTARKLYPAAVHHLLEAKHASAKPDFLMPDDLDSASHLGQILRLNQAVALSIAQDSQPNGTLATKKDPASGKPRLDWTLGPGISELHDATGADYALFTFIRDSYASKGRLALRGVATLVNLRTGKVVWFNQTESRAGDLRSETGTATTVDTMLKDLPL